MNDESPRFLAIGKIDIDDAFLDQVAWSRMRSAQSKAPASNNGHSPSSPAPGSVTPKMRAEAKAFIEEYFLAK